jgi:hypothetical protein
MKWRDIIIGALITLFVTITAGVIVYYATREPAKAPTQEKLVYQVEQPNCFLSEKNKITLLTIRIGNLGSKEANSTDLVIKFPKEVRVLDKQIQMSSAPAGKFEDHSKERNTINLNFPTLLAGETATISLMLDAPIQNTPEIGLRSTASVGKEGPFIIAESPDIKKKDSFAKMLVTLVPLAAFIQLFLLALLSGKFRSLIIRFIPTFRSVNDTAFLYIHQGLQKEAEQILRREIRHIGANAISLANYGLVLCLNGRIEEGKRMLKATQWYSRLNHEKAVTAFNYAIVEFAEDNIEEGKKYLKDALKLSKHEITRYCEFSEIIKMYKEKYPEIGCVINPKEKN